MFKLFYTSSENNVGFGVSKVVDSLNHEIKKKKIRSIFSNRIIKFLFFNPDIIHINGCWKIRLLFLFVLAKLYGTKIVISPHGMIDPFSLNQKKFKKKMPYFFIKNLFLKTQNL